MTSSNECDEQDIWKTAATIYPQKFLSYLIVLITILVIHLQIFFNILNLEKNTISTYVIGFIIISNIPLFISLCIFGYLVYRTSIELYSIEVKNKTISCIFDFVKECNIKDRFNLYSNYTHLFKRPERKISDYILAAIIVLIIIDGILSFFITITLCESIVAILPISAEIILLCIMIMVCRNP